MHIYLHVYCKNYIVLFKKSHSVNKCRDTLALILGTSTKISHITNF